MKKITIINAQNCTETGENEDKHFCKFEIEGQDEMEISDGYHTFGELYEHRIILFIALCKQIYQDPQYQSGLKADIWRSKLHSDGSCFEGWFVLGMGRDKGEQITYHLPLLKWEETNFAETREKAPEWDGHTSQDVLDRIKNL